MAAFAPRRSGAGSLNPSGQGDELDLVWIGAAKGELDLGFELLDAYDDLEDGEADGAEHRGSPGQASGRSKPQAVHQPIGGGVQDETELIGLELMAGGAVGGGVELEILDQIFHAAALAIDFLVDSLGAPFEVGDDQPDVGAMGRGLDAGDHPALLAPTFGLVGEAVEAAQHLLVGGRAANCGFLDEGLHDLVELSIRG